MLAPPYSFHGPTAPADARLRRNRRPSHTLTVDPATGLETLFVRFAITAADPLADAAGTGSGGPGDLVAHYWDWAKRWIGPLVWDDSTRPGAYDPKLSNGLTASELEAKLERERREQLDRDRAAASWSGWAADRLGAVVGSMLGGLGALRGPPTHAASSGAGGDGGYFRRPRKPAYGEYTSAEVVAELQKVRRAPSPLPFPFHLVFFPP